MASASKGESEWLKEGGSCFYWPAGGLSEELTLKQGPE